MKNLAQFVGKAIEALVVLILAAMSILVFLNVVLRYGFHSSIAVSEEVSRYLFVWLTFLGAVLAFNEGQHVSVTVLTDKLSPVARQLLRLATDGLMLFCCYLVIIGGWVQFELNLTNLAPISGLPQGITFLACVVGTSLIALLIVARIFATTISLSKGEAK